jgi:NAD(P)-dependent dehydrogenase (short-subunit alcohol dehydrogenase family)
LTWSAVVTGSGLGIGRATLESLLDEGWFVVGVEVNGDLAAGLGTAVGDSGAVVLGDATDRASLARAAEIALERAPLFGWVNNAGIVLEGSLHAPLEHEVERVVKTNLMGVFWGCSTAILSFMNQGSGGSIVNISSIHGRRSFPGFAAYDASKGAVDALTRNVAVTYGPIGIRSNAIAPGAIRTPLLERGINTAEDPEAALSKLAAASPLRRIGEPREIASVVSFLLSERASYLTGQSIAVDGGWSSAGEPTLFDPALAREYNVP